MKELEQWSTVFRRVDPLPGGVAALRRRLRAERAPRGARLRLRWIAPALAVACAVALLAWWFAAPRAHVGDRVALDRLLGDRPPPAAVALGLAAPATSASATDPRIDDGPVVFRWVSPTAAGPERSEVVALDPRDRRNQLR